MAGADSGFTGSLSGELSDRARGREDVQDLELVSCRERDPGTTLRKEHVQVRGAGTADLHGAVHLHQRPDFAPGLAPHTLSSTQRVDRDGHLPAPGRDHQRGREGGDGHVAVHRQVVGVEVTRISDDPDSPFLDLRELARDDLGDSLIACELGVDPGDQDPVVRILGARLERVRQPLTTLGGDGSVLAREEDDLLTRSVVAVDEVSGCPRL